MPLLSICIPCYGRITYVRNTLKSIFIDNKDVNLNDYEVIISDNDPNHEIESLCAEFPYDNLHYYRTNCEGFMNSFYALTYANGELLKLHNSQSLFLKGSLNKILDEIKYNHEYKTLFFYSNGLLDNFKSTYYNSFNKFMNDLTYWSSWSNGFCIWKEEFNKQLNTPLNHLFPHTSLFITQHKLQSYCINDNVLFKIQRIPNRGGHNKFKAFTIDFPSIIEYCVKNNYITTECRKNIYNGIVKEFLPSLIFNKYIARIETFDDTDFKTNIRFYLPACSLYKIYLYVLFVPFRLIYRKIKYILNY